MDAIFLLLLLASFCGILYGFFLMIFKTGKRKRGWNITVGSTVALVAVIVAIGVITPEQRAADRGFDSAAEMQGAEDEGITDPEAWAAFKAEREREAELERQRVAEAEEQAEQEERRKGFHCLSAWDGSHTAFKRKVSEAMRNPSSLEHVETRIAPVDDDGQNRVIMTYRAENGFGGMNVGQARGLVDNETCEVTITAVE